MARQEPPSGRVIEKTISFFNRIETSNLWQDKLSRQVELLKKPLVFSIVSRPHYAPTASRTTRFSIRSDCVRNYSNWRSGHNPRQVEWFSRDEKIVSRPQTYDKARIPVRSSDWKNHKFFQSYRDLIILRLRQELLELTEWT